MVLSPQKGGYMILCPRCLMKIDKELHEVTEKVTKGVAIPFKCPACRQEITNLTAISTVPFPDCVSKVKYVGINTPQNANLLLKMMQ